MPQSDGGHETARSAVVDRARVDQLLALLARYVRILRSLSPLPLEEFAADPRNYGSAERFLQLAIETVHRGRQKKSRATGNLRLGR